MRTTVRLARAQQDTADTGEKRSASHGGAPRLTFTGVIGAVCMFPLRAIIAACVKLRVHPNVLTFVGVVINVGAAWAVGAGRFLLAGVVMIVANIFDLIAGKVAVQLQLESRVGAVWGSALDCFSDLGLLVGRLCLLSALGGSE